MAVITEVDDDFGPLTPEEAARQEEEWNGMSDEEREWATGMHDWDGMDADGYPLAIPAETDEGRDEDIDALGDADAMVADDFTEDGIVAHYERGRLHREGGPALILPDGTEEWYQDGRLHRSDGGPAVTHDDVSMYWYESGQLHRTNGPAIIRSDRTRAYYRHGKLHRTDGPAIEGPYIQPRWYLRGRRVHAHGHKFARARDLDRPTPAWLPPPDPYREVEDENEDEDEDRTMDREL